MRRLRGLLNKLTEQTMAAVSAEVASLFGSGHAREMCAAFAQTMLAGCLSETQILAPLVLLNAALVRALSIKLGQNVLTTVVEAVVVAFEAAHVRAIADDDGQQHACCNAALLLAHLYNFGAVHASLLYELIQRLVKGFGEAELQMLIVILRAVGPQLRADDPTALKNIVLEVQTRAASAGVQPAAAAGSATAEATPTDGTDAEGPSGRARVFVAMLTDLKNNKHKARELGAADGALGRLRKWLRQLTSAGASEPPPFKVKWDELVQANERGRWWIVGSAWAGRLVDDTAGDRRDGKADGARGKPAGVEARSREEQLLRLADGQRMNTDVRRSIFVAIMGADDYVDAHARITKLRLTKGQQPEIVRVLLECCAQEGLFNRFYALLGVRLCEAFREVRFAMSFAFWDAFKLLPDGSLHRAANTAKLLAQLVTREAVSISTLKVVQWQGLPARSIFFWQVFFVELLSAPAHSQRAGTLALREPALADVRDGVLVFLERHLRRMVAKEHPTLRQALQALVDSLDTAS